MKAKISIEINRLCNNDKCVCAKDCLRYNLKNSSCISDNVDGCQWYINKFEYKMLNNAI
jgi:hypothetical protein